MYYVYHVKGVKVGCTNNLKKRVEQEQGYSPDQYSVLFETSCVRTASKKEKYFQDLLGYSTDQTMYHELPTVRMKTKIAEGTVTFGKATDVITKEILMDEIKVIKANNDTERSFLDYEIHISEPVADWILSNLKRSQYGYGQFVYLNALKKKFDVEIVDDPTVFNKIRVWADERGIYDKGDPKTQYLKLQEENGELAEALLDNNIMEIKDAIGDMVVVLTNLASLCGLVIEDCIDSAYNEIENRKGKMINGTFVKEQDDCNTVR